MKNVICLVVLGFALTGLCTTAARAQSGDTAYNIAFSDARNAAMRSSTPAGAGTG